MKNYIISIIILTIFLLIGKFTGLLDIQLISCFALVIITLIGSAVYLLFVLMLYIVSFLL